MKLLLRKDIANLGLCGDIVEVSAGYARNYLLPCHLALEPSKANLKAIEEDKKLAAEERARRHAFLSQMRDRLTGVEVTISAACTREGHLYGSVGPREISRALLDDGYSVLADQVKMSQNIKVIGRQDIRVVLADDIEANIVVYVAPEKGAGILDEEVPATEAANVVDVSTTGEPQPDTAGPEQQTAGDSGNANG
jgi:large subunit ribosomal protein L9